ncbi:MAG: hemolysin family protein [Candidatus Brocadiales bacterium]|nr:HlyC/CorC family transporter [Candidatus Bathyanammoxibius sp.]MCQ4574467.1 hemolysin family protein [Candidatus Bathyanammoxibius amoris]
MEEGSRFFLMEWLGVFCLMGVLLFLSALFSSSETALFSLGKEDIKRLKGENTRIGSILAGLTGSPKRLLITILLGNTAVNVAFYSISFGLSREILNSGTPDAAFWAWMVGFGSLLAVIVLGEAIPKSVAVRIPEHLSRLVAVPISILEKLLLPVRVPITMILDGLGKLFAGGGEKEPYITAEELKVMLALSERHGVVDTRERTMIHAVLDFGRMRVKDAMVPRVDMTTFDISDSVDDFLALVRKTKHKKVPVYEGSNDNILGVVYAKDVFLNPGEDLRTMIRDVTFVPETKTIESLLREFRREHQQMAVVADEYGGTAGLITLEDILEEVVGEIQDETERYEEPIRKLGGKRYMVHGSISLMDWCETFGVELNPVADTIGGYVVSLLGRIPQKNDSVSYKDIVFTVKEVRKRRITRLLVEFVGER